MKREKDVVPGVQHVHSFTSGVSLSKISVGDLFLSSFVFQEDFWYSFWSDKYVKEREKKIVELYHYKESP